MKFVEITNENWEEVIRLRPKVEQNDCLRTDIALHSLARAYVQKDRPDRLIPYAIEENGQLIGMFLLRNYGIGCNLTSFFIDHNFQGKGFGRATMNMFISYVKANYPHSEEIELAVSPCNKIAESLYLSLGFEYTGQKTKKGNLYMELHF